MNQVAESVVPKLVSRRRKVVANGVGQFAGDTVAASGSGSLLTDGHTNWIDFTSGIGVTSLGHCPEDVVAAIKDQAEKLLHTCIHVASYESYIALCETLVDLIPHGSESKVMLTNSGAESVENAIKIARQATGRQSIIAFEGAFHGRTMMSMSLTSKTAYKTGCGPFAPEVYRLKYPQTLHDITAIKDSFTTVVDSKNVAAIIIEPVLGEGGFIPAPAACLKALRQLCDETGILLICDEVQSGFCRTGRWAAFQHAEIIPDISTFAKALGSGCPIGAVIGKAEVMDKALPGTIGGTYGGNPIACAAALATINHMKRINANEKAEKVGALIRSELSSLVDSHEAIDGIRGLGAMLGLVFRANKDRSRSEWVELVKQRCIKKGLLVLSAGVDKEVLRFLPPLNINESDVKKACSIIKESVLELGETNR